MAEILFGTGGGILVLVIVMIAALVWLLRRGR